ncbi:hypothetical protein CC79DRAFT_221172 [Sarocladium strictum]
MEASGVERHFRPVSRSNSNESVELSALPAQSSSQNDRLTHGSGRHKQWPVTDGQRVSENGAPHRPVSDNRATGRGEQRGPAPQVVSTTLVVTIDIDDNAGTAEEAVGSPTSIQPPFGNSSWGHIASLLAFEYVGYATLCLPWVFSKMGWGVAVWCLFVNMTLYIASATALWEFCLRHNHVHDIVDIVAHLTRNFYLRWVAKFYNCLTSILFYSITIAIMAFHIISAAEWLDTVTHEWSTPCKNVTLSVLAMLISIPLSLFRSFRVLSGLSLVSGFFTYIALVLACVFYARQDGHFGVAEQGPPIISQSIPEDTSKAEFVAAFLMITFATNGAVTVPTLVRDMSQPRDFLYALYTSSAVVFCTFAVFGGVLYGQIGQQYMTIPSIGTLEYGPRITVFSLMMPTIVFLGAFYAAVLARRAHAGIATQILRERFSLELTKIQDRLVWFMTLLALWLAAWLIANLVPFFSCLTSFVAAAFVSAFGFVIPACAWFSMRLEDPMPRTPGRTLLNRIQIVCWAMILVFGVCYVGVVGMAASAVNLVDEFAKTGIGRPFACLSGCEPGSH